MPDEPQDPQEPDEPAPPRPRGWLGSQLFPNFEKEKAERARKNEQARRALQGQINELQDTIPAVVPLLEAAKVFLENSERTWGLFGPPSSRWKELFDASHRYLKEHARKPLPRSHADECRSLMNDLSSWWLKEMANDLSEGSSIEKIEAVLAFFCAKSWREEMKMTRRECAGGGLSEPLGALDERAENKLRVCIGDMLENTEKEAWPTLARRIVTALLRAAGVTNRQADRIVPKWKPPIKSRKSTHSDDSAKRRNGSDNLANKRNDSDKKKSRRNGETP